ncbi:hypothetical protein GCM10025864_39380 [Luteimicrobium album]|uniref:Uncharacterized protein n=1 Tax=Luteimicrobium album TaxID=1054550 RepID=A0ABQ6I8X5_9MICO|nr:hypothetical protein [Luteimicrobium album]GMA26179.1 hypothetical protein GCM10025864_39380 [Luteimicrobium album]
MNDYVPTEDEVRDTWVERWGLNEREAAAEFDRFLAQVRAEAYEQARRDMQADFDASVDLYRREGAVVALREAADALSLTPSKWPWHVLRARADRIEAEG